MFQLSAVLMAISCVSLAPAAHAFQPQLFPRNQRMNKDSICLRDTSKPTGSFFNPVPDKDDNDNDESDDESDDEPKSVDERLEKLIKDRNSPPLASQPSTINGVPTAQASGFGFGKPDTHKKTPKSSTKKSIQIATSESMQASSSSPKPFIGIGPPDKPINDVTKPEYDDQGYTVYTNEETGEKSRVFEALVDYPCDFTMKIVGANEGAFVDEILGIVADSCQVAAGTPIAHKTRSMGKWVSVTVEAPVQSAEMLYTLYENIDKDPRVKFKF